MQPHPYLPPVGGVFHEFFRIERCIRAGGMGAIYEATDLRTSERRALKVLLPALVPDPEMRDRFCLEATATVGLSSEHLVEIFEAGVDGDVPFFSMEMLDGEDAGDRLKRAGPLSIDETLAVARQIATGLQVIHEVGVVHRDLKPENLFLIPQGGGFPRVKILDFGVAKVIASSTRSAHTTRSLGTPAYMAPEQIEGDSRIDERADLYALGHLVYTLLVGVPYYASEIRSGAAFSRLFSGRREPASRRALARGIELPCGFDGWFSRATALSPRQRFPSVQAQIDALESALLAPPSPSRARWWFALGIASLVGVAAFAGRPATPTKAELVVDSFPPAPESASGPEMPPGSAPAPAPTPVSSVVASASGQARAPARPPVAPRWPQAEHKDPSDFR